jgi:hypothetical protein
MVEIISKYDRSIVDKCCSTSGYRKHVDDLDSDIEIIHSLQIDITKTNENLRTWYMKFHPLKGIKLLQRLCIGNAVEELESHPWA